MSHGRHDFPTAIHLLHVRGHPAREIFFPAAILGNHAGGEFEHTAGLRFWEALVARVCDRHVARIHGYSWLPNEAILLLQRFAVPLRIILPSLLGTYSRYLRKTGRVRHGESPYACRCASTVVAPELLPYALRNLYSRSVKAGLSRHPLQYSFCSGGLHFASSLPPWFAADEFLAGVRKRGHSDRASIEQFLSKPDAARHARLFERLSSRRPQIAGELLDIEESMSRARDFPAPPSVEQVTNAIAVMIEKDSGTPRRVLFAALTAWYATRTGAATLAQMGERFGREPTTLRADIESHRKSSPVLFDLSLEEFHSLILNHSPPQRSRHDACWKPAPQSGGC